LETHILTQHSDKGI